MPVALGAIGLAAGWAWWWLPMTSDIERIERDRTRMQRVLAAAQAQADEVLTLQRATEKPPATDLRAATERLVRARGLQLAGAPDAGDGRVRVTLEAVALDELVALIDTLSRTESAHVVGATLVTRVEAGTVRAELTLARPAP